MIFTFQHIPSCCRNKFHKFAFYCALNFFCITELPLHCFWGLPHSLVLLQWKAIPTVSIYLFLCPSCITSFFSLSIFPPPWSLKWPFSDCAPLNCRKCLKTQKKCRVLSQWASWASLLLCNQTHPLHDIFSITWYRDSGARSTRKNCIHSYVYFYDNYIEGGVRSLPISRHFATSSTYLII